MSTNKKKNQKKRVAVGPATNKNNKTEINKIDIDEVSERAKTQEEETVTQETDNEQWKKILIDNENIIATSTISLKPKQKGIFQLFITDTPRIFYADCISLEVKDSIEWTGENAPIIKNVSYSYFSLLWLNITNFLFIVVRL